jgi:hypothetical protein
MSGTDDLTAKLQLEALKRAAEAAGSKALDAVETLLFGKVGGADEALAADGDGGGLEAVRRQLGAAGGGAAATPKPSTKAEAEAAARAELAELKRQAAARKEGGASVGEEPVERKRTL